MNSTFTSLAIRRKIDGSMNILSPQNYFITVHEKDGKVMIPISVQAHHSFVDGLHIGQFVEQLQKCLNEC